MGFIPAEIPRAKTEGRIDAPLVLVFDSEITNSVVRNILDQCLHIAQLIKNDCFIINESNPASLKQILETVSATTIVCFSADSFHTLTGLNGIFKRRGSVYESTLFPGKKVIGTIHPEDSIKKYLYRYYIISDLRRAKAESAFSGIRRTERHLLIRPTLEQSLAYLAKIKAEKLPVSFDIECNGALETSCIAFAISPTDAICIPFYKSYWSEFEEIQIWKAVADVLEDESITKIGQNLMFDISFLIMQNSIITKGPIRDTMIAQNHVYPDFPKGLDFLCSIYTDEPYYKDEGKIWKNPNIDAETFWRYNAKDATCTYEIWLKLEKELQVKANYKLFIEESMELFGPLLFMQIDGIQVNREKLEQTKLRVLASIDEKQAELNKLCGRELNVSSSKQCQQYFYVDKGLEPYTKRNKKNDTVSLTTDDNAMKRIARKGYKEASLIQDIRALRKLEGTYLDMTFDADNRLRCSYNIAGTTNGRLSSSQTIFETGANFQNIPLDFREFCEADPDTILVELDKVQAEWIAVAYISGDANMIEVVSKRLDAHKRTASLMFRKDMADVSPEERQRAKTCNHSLNYDMGYKSYALQYDTTEKEAKGLVTLYHNAYPGIRLWHGRTRDRLSKDRTLTNYFGRTRRFLDRWGDNLFKSAYGWEPASTVVGIVNQALIKLYHSESNCLAPIRLKGQVHDSILFQYPRKEVVRLYEALQEIIGYMNIPITCYGRTFVIPTEIKVGLNWRDMVKMKDDELSVEKLEDVIAKL